MIKLRDLQYLEAVARCQHFGQAAEQCHVSQPTLSGQIMKLEEQLELTLIERHKRGIMLTPAGEVLVAEARKVLLAANAFEAAAKDLKDPLSGELKLGLIPTLAPYLLPHVMPAINTALPRAQIFLYELQTHVLLEQLDSGELDILILPYLDEMESFNRYELFNEELMLATYPDHPLASKRTATLDMLKGHHVLTLEDGHCLRDQAMDYCFSAGAEEDQRFQATSLETLRHMVASGVGITLLPKLSTIVAPGDTAPSDLVYRKFKSPVPAREIVLLTRPNYTRMEIVREIVKQVRKAIKNII